MRCRRDNRLLEKRNAKIAARYYYWTEIQRYRSDDAIRQLSEEEFFLSEATIIRIIQRCNLNPASSGQGSRRLSRKSCSACSRSCLIRWKNDSPGPPAFDGPFSKD